MKERSQLKDKVVNSIISVEGTKLNAKNELAITEVMGLVSKEEL